MRFDSAAPSPKGNKTIHEETSMAKTFQQNTASKGSIEPRQSNLPPGFIPLPPMTDAEIDAELARRGETRAQVLAGFQILEASLRARFLPPKPVIAIPDDSEPIINAVRFYEERVAAGHPQWIGGSATGRDLAMSDLFGKQDWKSVFTTKVCGWSMTNDHITDGDVVLVDPTIEAKDGDIVVAHLPGEGQVVKRLRIYSDRVVLESAHPDFKPIVITEPGSMVIQGVVKGRAGPI